MNPALPMSVLAPEGPLLGDLPDENSIKIRHRAKQQDNVFSQPQPGCYIIMLC
ncbi:hypothetical protein [Rhizobium leguminosarum]